MFCFEIGSECKNIRLKDCCLIAKDKRLFFLLLKIKTLKKPEIPWYVLPLFRKAETVVVATWDEQSSHARIYSRKSEQKINTTFELRSCHQPCFVVLNKSNSFILFFFQIPTLQSGNIQKLVPTLLSAYCLWISSFTKNIVWS